MSTVQFAAAPVHAPVISNEPSESFSLSVSGAEPVAQLHEAGQIAALTNLKIEAVKAHAQGRGGVPAGVAARELDEWVDQRAGNDDAKRKSLQRGVMTVLNMCVLNCTVQDPIRARSAEAIGNALKSPPFYWGR